jgi:hypothetical protein
LQRIAQFHFWFSRGNAVSHGIVASERATDIQLLAMAARVRPLELRRDDLAEMRATFAIRNEREWRYANPSL